MTRQIFLPYSVDSWGSVGHGGAYGAFSAHSRNLQEMPFGRAGEERVSADGATAAGGMARTIFRGVTHLALDAKGRLAIPARHRDALSPPGPVDGKPLPMVITVDRSRCLLIYPQAEWEPIQSRLMSLPSFKPENRAVQRLMVGHADAADLDAAGRILVPSALREFAGLDHQVALVGQGNRFELWDLARWQQVTTETITSAEGPLTSELEGFCL